MPSGFLDLPLAMIGFDNPLVTVVIPVRDDFERLRRCLEALASQTYPNEQTEIIVVNNSSEPTPEAFAHDFSDVVFFQEPKPGSYAARNCGIRHSRGEILAFTDSDCIPDSSWIEQGVRHLLDGDECGLVGGRIDLFFTCGEPRNAVELYESYTAFRQKDNVEKAGFSVTANLFVYRRLFDEAGAFREDLRSRGDAEWTRRAQSYGHRIRYAPDAIVMHPARSRFYELVRKQERVAGGLYDFHTSDRNKISSRIIAVVRLLRPRLRFAYRLISSQNANLRLADKSKILSVQTLLQFVSAKEYLRRMLGGTARR